MDSRLRWRHNLPSITNGLTTRWSELVLHLEKLVRLADAAGVARGVDLLFLNTHKLDTTVTDPGDVRELFVAAPKGPRSPLNALLKNSLSRHGAAPAACFCFMRLYKQLASLPHVSLVNCSENEELVTVHAAEGTNGGYNRSVYVQDMVIGPFSPEIAKQLRARAGKTVRARLFKSKGPIYEARSFGRVDAEAGKAFAQVVQVVTPGASS
ncbi:hypothetical protein HK405_005154 [Cladochytrium tenue]|nr:hypothetical protein HK405_005154 [Cladochytrium tenue]